MAMIRRYGISSSPTRNPLLHHNGCKRMTLGMLLVSPIDTDRKSLPRQSLLRRGITNNDAALIRKNTLKDLMSSSKLFDNTLTDDHQNFVLKEQRVTGGDILPRLMNGGGHGSRRNRRGISRPVTASAGLRIRFLKRGWRPVLGAIPEGYSYDASAQ